MPGLLMEQAVRTSAWMPVAREIFADRAYEDDGTLTSRKKPGAVLHDAGELPPSAFCARRETGDHDVTGQGSRSRSTPICVHGDEPSAVAMARTVRAKLEANGVTIAPFRP